MTTVAFMGLGRMGSAMADRLLNCGYEVRVFNRTPSRTESLVAKGALAFSTPRQTCTGAQFVISMVTDDIASRAIWMGADGVFSAQLPPGSLAIECSTLSYPWVTELHAAASRQGLRYLDSPVTGLPDMAVAGALTLLVGAESSHLDAARPLLSAMSSRIYHFGAAGTGTAYKLLVNMLGAVQIASAAETMAIAERVGLDLDLVAQALASGQAASPQVIRNTQRMAQSSHDQNILFTPQLRLKDVDYALQLARQFSIGSPFGQLAGTLFRELCKSAPAPVNESKVIDVLRAQPADHGG